MRCLIPLVNSTGGRQQKRPEAQLPALVSSTSAAWMIWAMARPWAMARAWMEAGEGWARGGMRGL